MKIGVRPVVLRSEGNVLPSSCQANAERLQNSFDCCPLNQPIISEWLFRPSDSAPNRIRDHSRALHVNADRLVRDHCPERITGVRDRVKCTCNNSSTHLISLGFDVVGGTLEQARSGDPEHPSPRKKFSAAVGTPKSGSDAVIRFDIRRPRLTDV